MHITYEENTGQAASKATSHKNKVALRDCAFSCIEPKLWSDLLVDIRKVSSAAVFKVL